MRFSRNNYMSWINFKNYQETAIDEIRDKINALLKKEGNRLCVFKAPTGSGKTLMMAEWMMRFCDPYSRTDGKTFSFVWIAVNKLHDQSHDSLKKFYELKGMGLRCSYFHELEGRKIKLHYKMSADYMSGIGDKIGKIKLDKDRIKFYEGRFRVKYNYLDAGLFEGWFATLIPLIIEEIQ